MGCGIGCPPFPFIGQAEDIVNRYVKNESKHPKRTFRQAALFIFVLGNDSRLYSEPGCEFALRHIGLFSQRTNTVHSYCTSVGILLFPPRKYKDYFSTAENFYLPLDFLKWKH
nr:MAG TPA: hypothetical protein [Caudoviricetes sp.]